MGKIVVLDDFSGKWKLFMENNGVQVVNPYRKMRLFSKILHRINLIIPIYKGGYWYNKTIKSLQSYSVIFIYAYRESPELIKYICRHKQKEQRIIIWFWNPVIRSFNPQKIQSSDCEVWSFDKNDCLQYGMNYNTTYYFKEFVNIRYCKKEQDVLFLGLNKGRGEKIQVIKNEIERKGFSTYIHIVDETLSTKKRLPYMSYDEYLDKLLNSVAILDVIQEKQSGETRRVMEALFFQKKLITTQLDIVNSDYYYRDNIFIIGYDSWDVFSEFMNKPYRKIPKKILVEYEFSTWLKRFSI